jgi:hypothetical protein
MLALGLDEPGFLLIDCQRLDEGNNAKAFTFVEDPIVQNKVCSQIEPLPGYHPNAYPFIVTRNRSQFNLINTNTGRAQALIKDLSSAAWYQHSILFDFRINQSPQTEARARTVKREPTA